IAAALLVVLGAASGIALWRTAGFGVREAGTANSVLRLSVTIPPGIRPLQTMMMPNGSGVIVSGIPRRPDGSGQTRSRIYTRRLDAYEFKIIPGTEGATAFYPSPEGEWIAFAATVSEQSSQVQLKKVRIDGSAPPVVIVDWENQWGFPRFIWLEDGDLLVLD